MKAQITSLLFAALMLPVGAQDGVFLVPAAAVIKDDEGRSGSVQIWIAAANDKAIAYAETPQPQADDFVEARAANVSSLYFYQSADFHKAVDLYEARKYSEAAELFVKIKGQHEKVMVLKNNPGVLAAFYEMECLRKLGDLAGLSEALKKFEKNSLTDELKQRQLELYVLWDALRTERWDSLEKLVKERERSKLPDSHRVQIAYCHGRALEGLGHPLDALLAYQTAMTADAGASEVIARESALRVLEILNADPEVKESIRLYESSQGKVLNKAWTKVLEAAGVAQLFEMSLGSGAKLPEKFQYLLKYKTEPKPIAAEPEPPAPAPAEPKADEKPAPKPEEPKKDSKKDVKKDAKKDTKKDAKKDTKK